MPIQFSLGGGKYPCAPVSVPELQIQICTFLVGSGRLGPDPDPVPDPRILKLTYFTLLVLKSFMNT
jgi:hypothetical protein